MARRFELALDLGRLAFALGGVAAIAYQVGALHAAHVFDAGNFFSFFTIQSNVVGVATLLVTALVPRAARGRFLDAWRGGAALYLAITGAVFAVLLSGLQESLDTHIGWVNFVVHTLLPIVLVADWLVDGPRYRFSPAVAGAWLAYPVAWFAYTLIRGAEVGWYPYPFVDVSEHGYPRVCLNAAALLLGFAAAAAAFLAVGNLRARLTGVRPTAS